MSNKNVSQEKNQKFREEVFICVKPSFNAYKCAKVRLLAGHIVKSYWDKVLNPFQHGTPLPPVPEGKVDSCRLSDECYQTLVRASPSEIVDGVLTEHYWNGPFIYFNSCVKDELKHAQVVALTTKLDFFKHKFYCFVTRWYNALFGDWSDTTVKFSTKQPYRPQVDNLDKYSITLPTPKYKSYDSN